MSRRLSSHNTNASMAESVYELKVTSESNQASAAQRAEILGSVGDQTGQPHAKWLT